MELLATTGDAFVRVGAHTRLEGSGAQCLAVAGDTVYVGCRGSGLKRSADGGDTFEEVPLPGGTGPPGAATAAIAGRGRTRVETAATRGPSLSTRQIRTAGSCPPRLGRSRRMGADPPTP